MVNVALLKPFARVNPHPDKNAFIFTRYLYMQIPVTKEQKIAFKNGLKLFCQQTIQQRIIMAQKAMEEAQNAANGEEKSSAGDKYETSRAMSHLEKDMQSRQLAEHLKELAALHTVETNQLYFTATTGAFVRCGQVSFFLGAGLGKQVIDGLPVLFLSQNAPLTKLLMNKKKGDQFPFNGTSVVINDIF